MGDPYKGGQVAANPTCNAPATVKNREFWINPCAFTAPAAYTFGDLKNNSLFGPGSFIVNTGLSRLFPIGEHQQVEFRWEVFNLFNTPVFGAPSADFSSGAAGQITTLAGDPRVMQLALRLSF